MSDLEDGRSGLAGRHPRRERGGGPADDEVRRGDTPAEPRDGAPSDARDRSPGDGPDVTSDRAPAATATPITQQLGRIALVIIATVFVIFALDNAQHVDFSWLVGQTEVVRRGGERISGGVPLIVLLLAAFAAGAAVGSLVTWQRARHRRRR